jgi:hypothetical protein
VSTTDRPDWASRRDENRSSKWRCAGGYRDTYPRARNPCLSSPRSTRPRGLREASCGRAECGVRDGRPSQGRPPGGAARRRGLQSSRSGPTLMGGERNHREPRAEPDGGQPRRLDLDIDTRHRHAAKAAAPPGSAHPYGDAPEANPRGGSRSGIWVWRMKSCCARPPPFINRVWRRRLPDWRVANEPSVLLMANG